MQSTEGPPVEHVTVYGSTSGSVRSSSPNVQTTLANPMLTVQQTQTQATAFVQPTQQQSVSHAEPANQEPPSAVVEATPNSQVEWPSTSSMFGTGEDLNLCFFYFKTRTNLVVLLFDMNNAVILELILPHLQCKNNSQVSAAPGTSSMSKRPREEEDAADTETTQEDPTRAPGLKKVRIIQRVDPEVSKVIMEKDSIF